MHRKTLARFIELTPAQIGEWVAGKPNPGPAPGQGNSHGQKWGGIVEKTPAIWITWIIEAAKAVDTNPLNLLISFFGQPLDMATVELTYGPRYYFLCPLCHRRCEAIYHLPNKTGCRQCLRLGYLSQNHRPDSKWYYLRLINNRNFPYDPRYNTDKAYWIVYDLRREFEKKLNQAVEGLRIETKEVLGEPEARQALTLAGLLIEWELENPQVEPPPEGWKTDLQAARKVLTELLQVAQAAKG